jgi:fibronectin-binding autotransporter adhesin
MALRYFDRNGATAGFGTLTGAWDTTTASWSTSSAGTATPAAFTFTAEDTAQFGATGATSTAGTATIAAALNVTVNAVVKQTTGGQLIAAGAGGGITFAGSAPQIASTFDWASPLRFSCPITAAGDLSIAGGWVRFPQNVTIGGSLNLNAVSSTQKAGLYLADSVWMTSVNDVNMSSNSLCFINNRATFSFDSGFQFSGEGGIVVNAVSVTLPAGALVGLTGTTEPDSGSSLTGANNISGFGVVGDTSPTNSTSATISDLPSCIGFYASEFDVLALRIFYVGAGMTPANGRIDLWRRSASSSSGSTFELYANNSDSNPIVFTAGMKRFGVTGTWTQTLRGTSTADNAISGVINPNGLGTLSIRKSDAGRWVLSGANLYTGTTTITGGTLSAQSSSALGPDSSGSGGAISVTGGTLELSGGITLDKSGLNISTVTTA